ncbi:hypothetical protein RHM62_09860 [Actimicrobium sp. CCC2.4]|uniref:hypothetical protein n=1 Tax=Actimicrobium sp. CCC2.4 TaxID=3048606 RepID=UPI002AC9EB6B|nr:hypothetical protein [Actimicrobium sp. CCC2.4]WPX30583.1 hypothetical protein RHM62_09860 [Actimicrobium sp. CCC2.4]
MAGDVIPGIDTLRKVRWSRQGMGKRGGIRLIYFTQLLSGGIVLLLVSAKVPFDNLQPEFLLKVKEKFNDETK